LMPSDVDCPICIFRRIVNMYWNDGQRAWVHPPGFRGTANAFDYAIWCLGQDPAFPNTFLTAYTHANSQQEDAEEFLRWFLVHAVQNSVW
jgi:hypothetical protein